MRLFDRKFGADFLARVPSAPGVYRFYDRSGTLLYVGKARNLRRRLAQYRTTRRVRRDRKRQALVRSAERIAWEVCASELDAALAEIRLIQTLGPRANIAGAFPFLYPFIGIRSDGGEVYFCLTTSPEAFPTFDFHGAFRSREVTGEAFFALVRLLRFVGHPMARSRRERLGRTRHSYVRGFRRLPKDWTRTMWSGLLRGVSPEALEHLCLRLLESPAARARRAAVQADLRAVARFFDEEASPLAAAILATGHPTYPVPQRDRDAMFLRFRAAPEASNRESGLLRGREHQLPRAGGICDTR